MKKAAPQMKHPTPSAPKKKAQTKKIMKEPLAEGFVQEPHADYGTLNDEMNEEDIRK